MAAVPSPYSCADQAMTSPTAPQRAAQLIEPTTYMVTGQPYQVLHLLVGRRTTIPGWPSNDLAGLFDALGRWTLDPRLDMSGDDPAHPHVQFEAPYRSLAWGHCRTEPIEGSGGIRRRYVGTKPIYEGHDQAVNFLGNFLGYSFGFHIATDDPLLIAELDRLIALNMARAEFCESKAAIADARARRFGSRHQAH